MAFLFLVLLCVSAVQAQTQVTNTAVISPPLSVTNTNSAPSCSAGICTAVDMDTVSPSRPTISKAFSLSTINAGGTALLTVSITNNHALTSATLTTLFTDIYPTGLVNASPSSVTTIGCSAGAATATPTTDFLTLPSATLVPPASTCTISAVVTSSLSGTATNIIDAGSLTTNLGTNANASTAVLVVTPVSDVAIALSAPASSTPGQTLTVSVVITNAGPSTAQAVSAVITKPDGSTQTLTVGALAAGASSTTTITYVVPLSATAAQTFSANVTTTTADSNLANNSTSTSVALSPVADVITKVTIPATISASVVASGTVSFGNIGLATASNVSGTLTFSIGTQFQTIPAGANTTTVAGFPAIIFPSTMPGLGTVSPSVTTTFTFTFRTPDLTGAYSVTSTVATTTPEVTTSNNVSTATMVLASVSSNAKLSGRVYRDILRNKVFDPGTDSPVQNFRVELVLVTGTTTTVIGSATTGIDGQYTISSLPPGTGYSVRFFDGGGRHIFGTPFNTSPVNGVGQQVTLLGNPSTGNNTITGPVVVGPATPASSAIQNVTLYAGDNVQEQNLPLDPNGVVYDSITRKPIAGATVRLVFEGAGGFDPATQLLGGTDTLVTGANGFYQFFFIGAALNPGTYRLEVTQPAGFLPPQAVLGGVVPAQGVLVASPGITLVQPQGNAPGVGVNGGSPVTGLAGGIGTQYFFRLNLNFPGFIEVLNNHIPLDPTLAPGAILITKTGDKSVAEIGDSVRYTIRIRNTTVGPLVNLKLSDLLPAGFRYILGSSRLGSVTLANPAGGVGRDLTFDIASIAPLATVELSYFVRLGVGSQQGDGINKAQVTAPALSNVAMFKVTVQGGVFTNEGCITGKVYVDCDGNAMQNNVGGSRELGIPGVRLVMLDGTFMVTDSEGKYSVCGVKPQTHVVKVDRTTLPKGSRLVPSSNRNAGVGDSLFIDMKGGELARGDFIEGSCSPEVVDQVKARRAQGGVLAPEVEKQLPLTIENRPGDATQQILPETRQQGITPAKPGEVR